jgi:RNA polymerase sigma-70 factor (ECF subfamily)
MSPISAKQDRRPGAARPRTNKRPGDGASSNSGKSHPEPPAHYRSAQRGVDGRTDEQLLADYRRGDGGAFLQLVDRYQRELFHFLVRFLGNRATAEDIFQETFLQVHQSAHMFDPQRRFRPWLFTIAANKARDLMRANGRRLTSPLQASINPSDEGSGQFIDLMEAVVESPGAPMEKRELQERVQKTVMEMPEHLREILLLSYFHQFPYKQISEILDIPLGTVKSRLHAAVAHFADQWRALNPGRSGT